MPKKCYYEVLEVESNASFDQIKAAYRKCALRWHPDKNVGNEEAHEQFLAIREAFSVLSDPNERAWYDKHKDQILNESTEEFQYFNVFPYFTASCYNGFTNEETGFYSVYRKVFERIIQEDQVFVGRGELSAPTFGALDSDFVQVVMPFYQYWSQYTTKISFAWIDENISREYGRKAVKLIEKENRKKREKLRKERNGEIRNLVRFVKKRDRRVSDWQKKVEEEKKAKEKQLEEHRREQLLQKKRLNETYENAEWAKYSAIEHELEKLEISLDERFSEESESDDDSSDQSVEENKVKNTALYCSLCSKLFHSEKAFQNHEASKKHKQNVSKLVNTDASKKIYVEI